MHSIDKLNDINFEFWRFHQSVQFMSSYFSIDISGNLSLTELQTRALFSLDSTNVQTLDLTLVWLKTFVEIKWSQEAIDYSVVVLMPANFLEMARMAISMHAYHKICLMVKDIRGLETFQWRDIFQESTFEILMIS